MPFQLSISANTTAQPFVNTSKVFYNGCRFKSDGNNAGTVALGIVGIPASNALTIGANNTTTDGWKMLAGDEVAVPVSMAADLNKIWIIAGSGNQTVYVYGS